MPTPPYQLRGNWPLDLRTPLEVFRERQLFQALQPALLNSKNSPGYDLFELPLVILHEIASHLPLSSKAAFALTCRSAVNAFGTQTWEDLRKPKYKYSRDQFGRLLEKDFENAVFCYDCGKLHWTALKEPAYLHEYSTIWQLRQKMSFGLEKTIEAFEYLNDLLKRCNITCARVINFTALDRLAPQPLWEIQRSRIIAFPHDSGLLIHPMGMLPGFGLDFALLGMSPQDPANEVEKRIWQLRFTVTRVLRPSSVAVVISEGSNTHYPAIPVNGLRSRRDALNVCGPPQTPHLLKSKLRYIAKKDREVFKSRLKSTKTKAILKVATKLNMLKPEDAEDIRTDRRIREIRQSQQIGDRTMDLRLFRDLMWYRDRQLWVAEKLRLRKAPEQRSSRSYSLS